MLSLLLAFAVSLGVTLMVVHLARDAGHASHDRDFSGPQKFHVTMVPRVGGLGIVAGLVAATCLMWWQRPPLGAEAASLLLCGAPAFLAGLAEDLTKNQSPRRRLFFTAFSALLAWVVLDASIARTDIPGVDTLVAQPWGAALLTIFVVAGVANSINIIDGFNGLASMCSVLILVSLAYVAFQVDDRLVAYLGLAGVGAVLGFFIWNFPAGLIFLGDGGAYFLGFFIAELAILLVNRNAQVSPMFPLLVCIYPVFETVFSIYRRRVLQEVSPSMPDGIHLHSLVYRRVMRWAVGSNSAPALTQRNSMTSPYLWLLCMFAVVPAVLFWNNSLVLGGLIVLFGLVYVSLYWRIVRFKAPRWLIFRR